MEEQRVKDSVFIFVQSAGLLLEKPCIILCLTLGFMCFFALWNLKSFSKVFFKIKSLATDLVLSSKHVGSCDSFCSDRAFNYSSLPFIYCTHIYHFHDRDSQHG